MNENIVSKDESFLQQLPQSNIQNKTIEFMFNTARKICEKEEPLADYTHQTGSMKAVRLSVAMVMKYMPKEVKNKIKELYTKLETEIQNIENDSNMDDNNKKANKTKIEDEISMEILTLCVVTLTYSSILTEMREINILNGFDELIKQTRNSQPVNLFKEKEQ